jgi:PPOX class probable F420-dependent enzyme
MPPGPPPAELQALLREPNPCVIATVRPDGELHTVATWYLWSETATVLVNMDGSRRRLEHMRLDPRVALTVLVDGDWYKHVSLIGRVQEIRPDADLHDIDRIARHYTGKEFGNRGRDSWTAEIEVHRWHGWDDARDLTKP